MALLLWLALARFKLLIEDLRKITNIYDFMKCIEKHQQLLEYAKEITFVVRPFALGTVFFSTVSLIVFGLIFITGVSLGLKIQCVFLAVSALLEVFMYAWPAEHLIHITAENPESEATSKLPGGRLGNGDVGSGFWAPVEEQPTVSSQNFEGAESRPLFANLGEGARKIGTGIEGLVDPFRSQHCSVSLEQVHIIYEPRGDDPQRKPPRWKTVSRRTGSLSIFVRN
ncbi:hypothetical protein EAG_05800 [Camponotus floridanus]|uniref:Uncharacterized protein n=1 Tax=Camponotus floridanus TaxID=104421 RepID=E2B0J1_CAMFO|nr:hypothetical protein EAG_05800 [Camponotus floridanus]